MKKSIMVLLALFAACSNPNSENQKQQEQAVVKDSGVNPMATDTLYYLYTTGTKQQDTEAVKLMIHGDTVEGKMMYMPAEKDWRFGRLYGFREGDFLNLSWTFIQEGIKDSAQIVFKLEGDRLIQQSYSSDADTGENIVDTTSFIKTYTRTDRNNFPRQDFDMGLL